MSWYSWRPSSMALPHTCCRRPFCDSNFSSCGQYLSATSGRKDNGYVGGSLFDSYRLSSEAPPRWFGFAGKIQGPFFLLHMTHSLSWMTAIPWTLIRLLLKDKGGHHARFAAVAMVTVSTSLYINQNGNLWTSQSSPAIQRNFADYKNL